MREKLSYTAWYDKTMSGLKKQHGFTIVELLIVIVIIAILAAISIVAFNGVQQRARTTAITSELTQVDRLLQMYKVEYGTYPTAIATTQNSEYCVGTGFPNGKCDGSFAETNTSVTDELKKMGSLPTSHTAINGNAGPFIFVESATVFELSGIFDEGTQCPAQFPNSDTDATKHVTYCWKTYDRS